MTERDPANERLPPRVILLSWVSFFADVSSEMAFPLLPIFVVDVLGGTATTLGGIEGTATLVVACFTAWAGFASDKKRRRVPFIRLGYGLPVLGKALMASAVAWPMVLVGRLTDRVGKGLRTSPRDAYIADLVDAPLRGRAFGFHRAMDTAGSLLGSLLSAAILWYFAIRSGGDGQASPSDAWLFRMLLGVAAMLGLVSLATTFLLREEPIAQAAKDGETPDSASSSPPSRGWRNGFALPTRYWRAVLPLFLFALANSSDAFLLLRARDVGFSPWHVVLLYAANNATYAALSYPAGRISDRIGRRRVMAVGWLIYAAVYVGFAFASKAMTWPLFAIYGLYMALTDGVGKALVADHSPRDRRATALGIYHLASGLLTLAASLAGGLVWQHYGARATFLLGAGAALVAVASLAFLPRPSAAN